MTNPNATMFITRTGSSFPSLHLLRDMPLTCCSAGPQASPSSPIHGPNQWPTQLPAFDTALREHIDSMLHLGQHLMRGQLLQATVSCSVRSCPRVFLLPCMPNILHDSTSMLCWQPVETQRERKQSKAENTTKSKLERGKDEKILQAHLGLQCNGGLIV